MNIIDSHCHIYPDKIAEKASQNMWRFYDVVGRYNGTLSRLLETEKAAGVRHIIVQSVATTPAQVSSINRFIAKTVEENSSMTGLGTLHPDSLSLKEDFDEIINLGLKGIKLHADIQGIAINDPRCYKIYELCEGKLPVLMHAGDSRYKFSNPDNFVPVLKSFPRLTVIAAHFGGWSVWDEAGIKLSVFENLYVDTSSTFGFGGKELIVKCLNYYDENRILFGADYPMWDPQSEVNAFMSLGLPPEKLEKIFSLNAGKLYGISL